MYSRLIKVPNQSFFLFGPRGTGKTTWVRNSLPQAVYLDLLESELFNDLTANPQRLESFLPPQRNSWVVIDEVQRIPDLLNEVHRLIEARACRFVLTGSSARKLRRSGVNLLAGRALTYAMHPLTAIELGEDFQVERSLALGQLPSVYVESDPKAYLESYVKTYLREEIQQEGLVRSLGPFARFLEAASFSQASILNVSAVARDCGIERKVVENYFSILEDLLIAAQVPVFAKRAKRRIVAHPKFFFFDAGLYRTIRPKGPLDRPEQIEGHALETLIFQELRAVNDCLRLGYSIHYWRTADGREVDFVLYGEKGIRAFEVKRAAKPATSDFAGLQAFLKDYPMAKTFLLYGGNRRRKEGRVNLVPLHEALPRLTELLD
ncbi:MAG: ATP-binding protein [Elusimicrobia bacterium]|nr:ATP-binding protein [Elusimicrobiota bacterium]